MMLSLPLPRNFAKDERGAAAVEFALVSTVFITFIMAIAYIGMMLYTYTAVHWAVDDAARLAAINTSETQGQVSTAINNYLSGIGVPAATVTYTVSNAGSYPIAHIQASLAQTYVVPLLSTVNITFSADTYVPQGF